MKCCGEQSLIIQICTRDGAKRARCSISFISACVCNRSRRWKHFMCTAQWWKRVIFCNFEIEDNGKSLSTFVMQLSAPLHALHKRMKCESFIFLFTHHSYIQTVLYWSMEILMITGLKCFESRKFSLFDISTLSLPHSADLMVWVSKHASVSFSLTLIICYILMFKR